MRELARRKAFFKAIKSSIAHERQYLFSGNLAVSLPGTCRWPPSATGREDSFDSLKRIENPRWRLCGADKLDRL
jgi:hypothetical protein